MEIKDLEFYQLYLSGKYGAKIADTFKEISRKPNNNFIKYKKILETDGCEIYITDDNMLDFYGYFDAIYQSDYLKKINEYIKRMIFKVENESLRDKIIEIANLDLSRNSSYHIFNIEILVTCALRKPDYFFLIHTLLKEKYLYHKEKDNYEFLVFSVYYAETYEEASTIYDTIMQNSIFAYDIYNKNALYDLKEIVNGINKEELKEKIENNLQLIKI